MPSVCSAMNTCLSVRWQIHEQFLLPISRAIEDSWWVYSESRVLKALFFLNWMSLQALVSTEQRYKQLILPVGAPFASSTSSYLFIFNQHTVKYNPEWRKWTDGSKVFQGHCHQHISSRIYLAQGAQQSLNRGAVWGTNELPGIIVSIDPSRVGAPPAGQ